MTPKHSILLEFHPDGTIHATVEGVTGKVCGDVSKWLDDLGTVIKDEHTPDYDLAARQTSTVRQVGS